MEIVLRGIQARISDLGNFTKKSAAKSGGGNVLVSTASTYLQAMLGLSFARSRQAWRCFCAAIVSAFLVVPAVTAPVGVTTGVTVCVIAALPEGALAVVVMRP